MSRLKARLMHQLGTGYLPEGGGGEASRKLPDKLTLNSFKIFLRIAQEFCCFYVETSMAPHLKIILVLGIKNFAQFYYFKL
jgi:hypothetical protein